MVVWFSGEKRRNLVLDGKRRRKARPQTIFIRKKTGKGKEPCGQSQLQSGGEGAREGGDG